MVTTQAPQPSCAKGRFFRFNRMYATVPADAPTRAVPIQNRSRIAAHYSRIICPIRNVAGHASIG